MLRLRLVTPLVLFALLAAACVPASPTQQPAVPSATAPQIQANSQGPTALPTPTVSTQVPTSTPPISTPAGPTPAGAWISLSPQTASPGGSVRIQGYLPGGPDAAGAAQDRALQQANLCWQDCQSGLVIQGVKVEWSASAPGNFAIDATVPSVPYLGEDGPHELAPGDYTVGVQCLGPDLTGCATRPAQASAVLHLSGAAQKTCPNKACAELSLTPAQGKPGSQVQASGWAPLDSVIGQLPFGYSLVLIPASGQPVELAQVDQQMDGSFTAAFTVPQSAPGIGALQSGQYTFGLQAARPAGQPVETVATAPFELGSGLAWKDLGAIKPFWILPSANLTTPGIQAGPDGSLAYCTLGGIGFSADGGKTWQMVPAAGVEAAAQATGYPLAEETPGKPLCLSAFADSVNQTSFYAVFRTMKKDAGAPPEYFMGFYTPDAGKTWKVLPVPAETTLERFGGFAVQAQSVEALYSGESANSPQPGPVFGELTRDGGKTWLPGTLSCPASGPCLRWGPAASSISGMGSPAPQAVMISGNGGQTWTFPGPSVELRATGPDELSAIDGKSALLVSGSSDFPLQVTRDGGNNWEVVSLPPVPGATGNPDSGLQILPDGSLLAQSDSGAWQRLAPGAAAWCAASSGLPGQLVEFTAAGGKLWWLTQPDTGSGQAPAPKSVPLSALQCGG